MEIQFSKTWLAELDSSTRDLKISGDSYVVRDCHGVVLQLDADGHPHDLTSAAFPLSVQGLPHEARLHCVECEPSTLVSAPQLADLKSTINYPTVGLSVFTGI
jgi:hypothetical protein